MLPSKKDLFISEEVSYIGRKLAASSQGRSSSCATNYTKHRLIQLCKRRYIRVILRCVRHYKLSTFNSRRHRRFNNEQGSTLHIRVAWHALQDQTLHVEGSRSSWTSLHDTGMSHPYLHVYDLCLRLLRRQPHADAEYIVLDRIGRLQGSQGSQPVYIQISRMNSDNP